MIYPANIENKLGFDSIRAILKENCLSRLGTSFVDKMQFSNKYEKISQLLKQTAEFKKILESPEAFPASNYIDVSEHLEKARIEGAFLTEEEFYDLKLSLTTIFSCLHFFKQTEGDYPELTQLSGWVALDDTLLEAIEKIIDDKGHLRSNASKTLQEIRQQLLAKNTQLRKVIDNVLGYARSKGFSTDDTELTIRNGRMVIPVRAEHKKHIKGFIHDESSSGQTIFLEPAESFDLNNDIRELEIRERREIARILTWLTDQVRPYIDDLSKAYNFLGMMDFIRAKAKLAITLDATLPQELSKQQALSWQNARHPLLQLSLAKQGKKIEPFSIDLNNNDRVLVISGPNAGGKSVTLKSVGLIQYMLQSGLLVTVREDSTAGVFKSIFIDIGDEQSLENDLSTYSSHLTNMAYFLKFADKKSLFLIDEFGTGTEPQFGGAIAEAILENLNQKEARGVITTHYANLKNMASHNRGIYNGAMRFDTNQLLPLYQLETGKPGSSFALEIAGKIGLPEKIISTAKEKVGIDQVNYEKLLNQLENEKKQYEKLNIEVKNKNRRLEKTAKDYEALKNHLENQKEEVLNKARDEASQLLQDANKKIENTIKTIKSADKDKEKIRKARTDLETFKQSVQPKTFASRAPKELKNATVNVGDWVKIKDKETTGEVVNLKGNQAEVLIGSLKSNIKMERLVKIEKRNTPASSKTPTKPKTGYDTTQKIADFSTNLDIRGKRAEEVFPVIENFMDEAIMFGASELRIIHGKGNGVLRQVVRDYLQKSKEVKQAKDEHVDRGGAGVTVVSLK